MTLSALLVVSLGCGDCGGAAQPGPDAAAEMGQMDADIPDSEPTDTQVPDVAPDVAGDTSADAADMGEILNFDSVIWQSLLGPEGGSTSFMQQDPYHPDELYLGTNHGVYRTLNGGDEWTLFFAGEDGENGWMVGFGPEIRAVCSHEGVFLHDTQIRPDPVFDRPCEAVVIDGDNTFVMQGWEPGTIPFTVGIHRAGPDFAWRDISPAQNLLEVEFLEDGQPPSLTMGLSSIVVDDPHIAAVIVKRETTQTGSLFVSHDGGDNWSVAEIGSNSRLRASKVIGDPDDGAHLIVTLQAERFESVGATFPLTEFLYESFDHGDTWSRVTTVNDVAVTGVRDIDMVGSDLFLTDVDGTLVVLNGPDFTTYTRSQWPTVPGYSFGYALEELIFDVNDANRVWGRGRLGWDGVVRTDDGMQSWRRTVGGIVAAPTPNLALHPTDPNIVLASGNLGFLPHITRDRGQTWEPLVGTQQMADEAAFNPHDPSHVLMVSELSAMIESVDGGLSWQSPAPTFLATQVLDLATAEGGRIYASNLGSNIGVVATAPMGPATEWTNLEYAPDYAYDIEVDPLDPDRIYATYSPKPFEDFAAVYRYDPTAPEPGGWKEALRVPGATGMTSVALDASQPSRLYAASTGAAPKIWESVDRGESFAELQPGSGLTFSTVHALAVDPKDGLHVIAAPWGGGLFETRDGAQTWTPMESPTASVSVILFDPDTSLHLRIGDRTQPVVWESGDGGMTWARIVDLDPDGFYRVMAMADFDGALYVSVMNRAVQSPPSGTTFRVEASLAEVPGDMGLGALAFAPGVVDMVAVGHFSGIYKLEGGRFNDISGSLPDMGFFDILRASDGTIFAAGGDDVGFDLLPRIGDPAVVNDIYRTNDDGQNWTPLLADNRFGAPVKALDQHPVNADVLLAATNNGLWLSKDFGASWQEQPGLGFSPIGSMAVTAAHVYVGTLGGGVYRGTFDPQYNVTWGPSYGPHPEVYNVQVDVDPTDSDTLYATAFPGGVFKSVDRGATWAEANFALPSFSVPDPVAQGYYTLEIDPSNADVLYLGVYRHGVFKSTDGAATWMPMMHPAIVEAPIRKLALDPGQPNILYAATEEGVLRSDDGAATWAPMNAGLDTLQILTVHVSATALVIGTAGYGAWIWSETNSQWENLGHSTGIGEWRVWDRRLYQYTALLFAPDDPAEIYLGNFPGGFFASEDRGQTWSSRNLGLGNDGIFSLAVHPGDPNVLFAGTYNGIMRSDDRGRFWFSRSTGLPDEQWPFAVVIDDQNPLRMYATTKNGQNKGFCDRNTFCGVLMRSDDGAESWYPIMDGMDDQREYYMLIIHPDDHDVLFVSTSQGVFASQDAGDSWVAMNTGLPTTEHRVRDNVAQNLKLAADSTTLYLGVVDYGVWFADLHVLGFGE